MGFKISVIVPMYNLENYISTTLNSIINQSNNSKLELIVVDDGSIDNSYIVAKETLENSGFSNYKIIKKENGGVSSARNAGLNSSSGDYVIFLDGDDIVSPNLVQSVNDKLSNGIYDVVFWGCDYVNEDKTTIMKYFSRYAENSKEVLLGEDIIEANLTKKIKICTGNIAIKKEILMKYNIKYYDGCASGEDQEFTQKVLCKIDRGAGIDASMTYYVFRKGSISQSNNIRRFDSVYALKRMFDYLEKNSSDKIQALISDIKDEKIINNYLGNVNNSIRHLNNRNYSKNNSIYDLFKEINLKYPDMESYINFILKNKNHLKFHTKFRINFLMISKVLYSYLLSITDFIMEYILARNKKILK